MPKFASTLRFSRYFILIQGIMLAGSLASIGYVSMPVFFKILLIWAVSAWCVWNVYSHRQWQSIGHDENGWYLEKAGTIIPVIPSGDSTLTSFVAILCFRQENKWFKQSCMIFKDSMSDDDYRRFLVRMKYCKENGIRS